MKKLYAIVLLIGVTAMTVGAQTNTTNAAPRQRRGGGGGGVNFPSETNAICWTGMVTNAQGENIAKVVVDVSEVPELEDWGKHAGEICVEWYPKIAEILGVESSLKEKTIHLWFRKDMGGVANTSPSEGVIRISSSYVKDHTNDWGMVVHELVHTVQSFPRNGGGGGAPPPAFAATDITDAAALAARLKKHSDPVSKYLWENFSKASQKEISKFRAKDTNVTGLQTTLAKELSNIVRTNEIYSETRFAKVTLSEQTKTTAEQSSTLQGPRLSRFNRALLADAYPDALAQRMGAGGRGGRGGRGGGNPADPNGSWLTEGIADYVRLGHYEPDANLPRIDPDRAHYYDSYKTTATFYRWIEKNYDPSFIKKINIALHDGKYNISLFKDYTGKTVDDLWKAFADDLRAKKPLV